MAPFCLITVGDALKPPLFPSVLAVDSISVSWARFHSVVVRLGDALLDIASPIRINIQALSSCCLYIAVNTHTITFRSYTALDAAKHRVRSSQMLAVPIFNCPLDIPTLNTHPAHTQHRNVTTQSEAATEASKLKHSYADTAQ